MRAFVAVLALAGCETRVVDLGVDAAVDARVETPADAPASACRCRITPCRTNLECTLTGGVCGADFYCTRDFGACSMTSQCLAMHPDGVCTAATDSTAPCAQ